MESKWSGLDGPNGRYPCFLCKERKAVRRVQCQSGSVPICKVCKVDALKTFMRKRDERITTHNAIVSWLCAEDDYGVYLDFKENDDFSLEFDRSFDECQWAYSEFTLNMECEEGFCRPSFEEWLMLDLPDDTSDCLGCEGCELSMHEEDGPYDRFAPRMNNREAIAYAQSIF